MRLALEEFSFVFLLVFFLSFIFEVINTIFDDFNSLLDFITCYFTICLCFFPPIDDGKITEDEIQEGIEIIQNGVDDLKDKTKEDKEEKK